MNERVQGLYDILEHLGMWLPPLEEMEGVLTIRDFLDEVDEEIAAFFEHSIEWYIGSSHEEARGFFEDIFGKDVVKQNLDLFVTKKVGDEVVAVFAMDPDDLENEGEW